MWAWALGSGGNPLTNVAANLPSAQNNTANMGNIAAGNAQSKSNITLLSY